MTPRSATPFWRDIRFWRIASQVLFLAGLALLAVYFVSNMQVRLARSGISLGFGFLQNSAGFGIGEGLIPYNSGNNYLRAFQVGFLNTLRVALIGIVLATPLGILVGIARLSTNWLVNKMSAAYVELLRNTPLMLQCVFWYFAVFMKLPPVDRQVELPGPIYLNNRGIFVAWFERTGSTGLWFLLMFLTVVGVVFLWRLQTAKMVETGKDTYPTVTALAIVAVVGVGSWFAMPEPPMLANMPAVDGTNVFGGAELSPEFTALLCALIFYTSSFIAEIVRSGIQSVSKGQVEAARALGLRPAAVMRLVVFPQALRVIIPPLTSQYLNLTKNSSLAYAIGYPDVFFIAVTINNQTGRAVEVFMVVMAVYLTFSLITSILMNLYNRSVRLVER